MATRKSPTPSSTTSEVERLTNGRTRVLSNTSHETQQTASRPDQISLQNAANLASIADTRTVQSNSSAVSLSSAGATGTPYDAISLAASMNTGFTGMTGSKAQSTASIPIIAPPSIRSESQQPIQVDVASAYQQYQRNAVQSDISPSSGSTISSSGTSLSSPGSASIAPQPRPQPQPQPQPHPQPQSQPHYHLPQTNFHQVQANHNNAASQQNFQQWSQTGQAGSLQNYIEQEHQSQWNNQLNNPYTAMDSFTGGVLHIDYGAIEAYNIGLQSSDDFVNSLVRPAEMTGGGKQPHFDPAKAIFNQVDANHDGSISREEFRQWASGGQQFSQSYGNNYQTTGTGSATNTDSFYSGATGDIASILRQSGLGPV